MRILSPKPFSRNPSNHSQSFMKRPWGWMLVFIGPALALYFAFIIIPVGLTFFNSVHLLHMNTWEMEYIGLANYKELLPNFEISAQNAGYFPYKMNIIWEDKIFQLAIKNSLIWAFLSPILEIPIAFILAFILSKKIPLKRFFRVSWFTPMLISWVVVGVLTKWVFNNDWGVVNTVLNYLGLHSLTRNWLGDPKVALYCLIGVTTWKFIGFNMVLMIAGLAAIPEDLLDAARVDGVNQRQLLRYIIIPLMRTTIANALILCFIGKMNQFALIWVSTGGGPMHYTETVATYMQKRAFAWRTLDLGYPSTIAVIWFLVIFILTLLFTRILQRREALEY